jgi:hypothetical protein
VPFPYAPTAGFVPFFHGGLPKQAGCRNRKLRHLSGDALRRWLVRAHAFGGFEFRFVISFAAGLLIFASLKSSTLPMQSRSVTQCRQRRHLQSHRCWSLCQGERDSKDVQVPEPSLKKKGSRPTEIPRMDKDHLSCTNLATRTAFSNLYRMLRIHLPSAWRSSWKTSIPFARWSK